MRFFIRYADPNFHIRLRLFVPAAEQYGYVMRQLHEVLDECYSCNMISNVASDMYIRELERYGDETIELCEDIFCVDSHYVVKLLNALNDSNEVADPEQLRWELALLVNDDLFDVLGCDVLSKNDIITKFADSYKREFNLVSKAFTKQVNDKYRKLRPIIDKAYARQNVGCEDVYSILEERKSKLGELISRGNTLLSYPKDMQQRVFTSLMHMSMNRLFRAKNRIYELVIYDFMQRYYKSIIARNKMVK